MKHPSGYGVVYKAVLTDPSIKVGAKAVYALLASFTGADDCCWPSIATLSSSLGVSESTVRGWIKELEKSGLLEVERSDRSSNTYTLLLPPAAGRTPPSDRSHPTPSDRPHPTINNLTKNKDKGVPQRFVTDLFSELFERESGGEKYPWATKDFSLLKTSKILSTYSEEKISLCVEAYFSDGSLWFNKNGGGKNFAQMISHWGELLTSRVTRRGSEKVLRMVPDGNGGVRGVEAPRLFEVE